jgi:GcrA cell cycle regulator
MFNRQTTTTWTSDRVARLKSMWAQGASATVIGDELGLTRCAVLGKVNRLHLTRPETGDRPRPKAMRKTYRRRASVRRRPDYQAAVPASPPPRRPPKKEEPTKSELRRLFEAAWCNTAAINGVKQ